MNELIFVFATGELRMRDNFEAKAFFIIPVDQ